MKRFLGLIFSASALVLFTAPIATVGQTGCGGCYGTSCPCADGTTLPTKTAPCNCPELCASHGGVCNGTCTGTDAGKDAELDAPADVVSSDGGLQSGADCDLQNDACAPGLKCCTEPTHIPDASTHDICAPIQEGGVCPMYP